MAAAPSYNHTAPSSAQQPPLPLLAYYIAQPPSVAVAAAPHSHTANKSAPDCTPAAPHSTAAVVVVVVAAAAAVYASVAMFAYTMPPPSPDTDCSTYALVFDSRAQQSVSNLVLVL